MHHHSLRWLAAIVLGTASALTCAPAPSAGLRIAGGEIDDSFTGADLYIGTPREADAPRTKACRAAKSYIVNINAGQFSSSPKLSICSRMTPSCWIRRAG
jgi:hypothetical protein